MKLKVFRLLFLCYSIGIAQNTVSGIIKDNASNLPMANVKIYDKDKGLITASEDDEEFDDDEEVKEKHDYSAQARKLRRIANIERIEKPS